jgi:serine/threonine protein kinase
MAVVYLAQDQDSPDHEVAIKVLTPESSLSQATITRFMKEGQAISLIRHPNVIQLVEPPGRTHDGQVYLVMELLTGKPLSEIVGEMTAAGQAFTWPRLAPLILQICRALAAAHKQKVVHRDMKPSNCFCTELEDEPWHIKVLDFGIAKIQSKSASDDSIETPLTQDGMFVGTPHFAAPRSASAAPRARSTAAPTSSRSAS